MSDKIPTFTYMTAEEYNQHVKEAREYAPKLYDRLQEECSNAGVALMVLTGVMRTMARAQNVPLTVIEAMIRDGVLAIVAEVVPATKPGGPTA